MSSSPVWNAAAISSIVSAAIALLVSFGVPLTSDQTAAILGFVAVVAPFVVAMVVSRQVTSLAQPQVQVEGGRTVDLVRADTQQPTPQAQARSMSR